MGIGLMYLGVSEPMSHYVYPALPTIVNKAKDAQLATFLHWGIHAWSIFALAGLILAYFSFRYKLPLSIRSGFCPILKERIYGPIGDVVDVGRIPARQLPATLSPNANQQHVQPTLHLLSLVRLNQRLVSLRLHAPYSLYGKQDMTDVMIFCEETGGKNRLPLLEIPSESCTIQIICVSLQ